MDFANKYTNIKLINSNFTEGEDIDVIGLNKGHSYEGVTARYGT